MTIFITGASGYTGGAVALKLLEKGLTVRALVRSEAKAEKLKELGIIPVIGDLDNSELLIAEAKAADGVINTADSDHRGAVEAFIKGLQGTNKPLLHTSGTGLFADNARGEYASPKIYNDLTEIKPEPGNFSDRAEIDQLVRDAAHRGIRSVVICNTNIYGWGKGLHTESIQLPWLIREAKKHNEANYVGKGANIWSNVHIDDLADLYIAALNSATAGSFYFAENGETSFLDTAKSIAKRFNLPGPVSWSVDDATAKAGHIYAYLFGSNSRVRTQRAKAELHWKPSGKSLTEWIETEA